MAEAKVKPGAKFGKITIIREAPPSRRPKDLASRKTIGTRWWITRCDCGKEEVVAQYRFTHPVPKLHCGCENKGLPTLYKREYNSWQSMMSRCYYTGHVAYKHYGGRGITVCPEWHDFERFLADMGRRPRGQTLDRRNANGNYTPDNVRWATKETQAWNKRETLYVSHPTSGVRMPAGQAAKSLGMTYQAFRAMMIKEGKWPTSPVKDPDSQCSPTTGETSLQLKSPSSTGPSTLSPSTTVFESSPSSMEQEKSNS